MRSVRGIVALGVALALNAVVWAAPIEEQMAKARSLSDQGKFKESAEVYKSILIENKDLIKNNHVIAAGVWQSFGESLAKGGWKVRADDAFKRASDHRVLAGCKAASVSPDANLTASIPDSSATSPEAKAAASIPDSSSASPEAKVTASIPDSSLTSPDAKLMDKYRLASVKSDTAQEAYRRGSAYFDEGRLLYAVQEFTKALEAEPDNQDLMEVAARAMVEYGEPWFDKAKTLMESLRKAKGDTAMTHDQWIVLGRAAANAKKYDFKVAEESLQAALKENAQSYPAHIAMGELLLLRGEYKKAIEWFEKARKIKDGDLRILWGIGDAYTGLSEMQKALDAYSAAYDVAQQNSEAVFKFATGLKNVGRIDDAIRFHEVAIALDPARAKYHLGLVDIYLPRIMDFSAKKHLDAALVLEPENPWCHYYNGVFMEMRRRIDDAVMEYNTAAYYGPQMLDVKYQLANIFAAIGNAFPGNNFSNDNASDKLEYLPYKDLKQAGRLYNEILAINPKYKHASEISVQLAGIEELNDVDRRLQKTIDSVVR